MSEHDERADEELFGRAVAGELAADSQALRELFARRPELAATFADLRALRGELDEVADEQRAIAAARAQVTDRDRRAVSQALGAKPELAAAASSRPTRWALAALAAAAVIALVFAVFRSIGSREPRMLSGRDEIVVLDPKGDVADYASFRWTGELGPAETFVVRISEASADGSRGIVRLESPRCSTTEWTPTDSERAALPDAIVWWVERLDASSSWSRSSDDVFARRSP